MHRALPSGVVAPVLTPPCIRHRPLGIAAPRQGWPGPAARATGEPRLTHKPPLAPRCASCLVALPLLACGDASGHHRLPALRLRGQARMGQGGRRDPARRTRSRRRTRNLPPRRLPTMTRRLGTPHGIARWSRDRTAGNWKGPTTTLERPWTARGWTATPWICRRAAHRRRGRAAPRLRRAVVAPAGVGLCHGGRGHDAALPVLRPAAPPRRLWAQEGALRRAAREGLCAGRGGAAVAGPGRDGCGAAPMTEEYAGAEDSRRTILMAAPRAAISHPGAAVIPESA